MTTLSAVASKEVLQKHPIEEYTVRMQFAPLLLTGEGLSSVDSVSAVLLDEDGEDTEDDVNITLANAAIDGTLVTVHLSDGLHGEDYRLEFVAVSTLGNTRAPDGRLEIRENIFARLPLYKQPVEEITYGMPFVNILASGDSLDSVTSVTAYRVDSTHESNGGDVNVTVGSGSINGTNIEAQISGGNHGERYRVEFVAETADGDVKVGCGLLILEDK